MSKKVYLCGPITGTTYEESVEGWRARSITYFNNHGVEALSPMRGKFYLKGLAAMPDEYKAEALSSSKGIVGRDRNDVRTCDVMLANLIGAPRVSIGSMVEYGWADAYRKPIVTILGADDPWHNHSFIRELSTYITDDLEDALDKVAILINVR
jgi:nucleoside 2-deoxyribosyltransferase